MKTRRNGARGSVIAEINLKDGMPRVAEALGLMERGLALARAEKRSVVKLIHGYGSSGVGGEIRVAVQKRLREMESAGAIRACIFGEDWSASDARTWELLKARPELKSDAHFGEEEFGDHGGGGLGLRALGSQLSALSKRGFTVGLGRYTKRANVPRGTFSLFLVCRRGGSRVARGGSG